MHKSLLFVFALGLVACEKNDEFSQAPSVSAPTSTEKSDKPAPAIDPGAALPANHPPMGGMGGQAMGGQAPIADAAGQVRFAGVADFGKTGPLRWEAPSNWTGAVPASSMRLAEYVVPAADGSQPGEISIFYFGPGGGGGVDANVQRWIGQFSNADGTPVPGSRTQETVNGMTVHRVDAAGTFNPGMAGNGGVKENQRMLGAIVETAVGLYFFKLVAPADTVAARAPEFEAFVKSFSPGA